MGLNEDVRDLSGGEIVNSPKSDKCVCAKSYIRHNSLARPEHLFGRYMDWKFSDFRQRLIMFLKSLFYILIFFNDSIVGVRAFESLSSPIKLQDSWTK